MQRQPDLMKKLIELEEAITAIVLALIVFFVFGAAITRTLGYPLIWSVDLAQLLFIWVCVLGGNQALRKGEHVGVDYFVRRFSMRVQMIIDWVLHSLVMALFVILIWFGIELTLLNPERDLGSVDLPYALVTAAVPAGGLLMLFTLGVQWLYLFAVIFKRKPADLTLPFMQKYQPLNEASR